MFDKSAKEKPMAVVQAYRSRNRSLDALDSEEGELDSGRLWTTILALVLSIFLVRIVFRVSHKFLVLTYVII
jgi:hypothetical protein